MKQNQTQVWLGVLGDKSPRGGLLRDVFQRQREMRGLEQKSAKWRVVTRKSWAKTFRPTISNLFQTDWFISPKNALDGIFHEGYICA